MPNLKRKAVASNPSGQTSFQRVRSILRPAGNAFPHLKRLRLIATCALGAAAANISDAASLNYVTNGSFEASGGSFNAWTATGATSILSNAFGTPTAGTFKAFIGNGSGSVSASILSGFFGGIALPANAGGAAVEGSGIKQSFTLQQPATLSFDYRYVSQEDIGSGYDETFFFLDGHVTLLGDSEAADLMPLSGLPLRYKNGTPYRTVTLDISAGLHTVGFGTYDTGDASGDSALLLDNVQAVPEPGTATFGIGLGLVVLLSRNIRRTRART